MLNATRPLRHRREETRRRRISAMLLLIVSLTLAASALPSPCLASEKKAEADHGGDQKDGGHDDKGEKTEEGAGEKKGEGEGKGKGEDTGIMGGRFKGDPIYVRIDPLVMPVISKQGAEQIVMLKVVIQVPELDIANKIHMEQPKVMDAIMRNLYGSLGEGSVQNGKMVDVAKIKPKIIHAISEVVGEGNVTDVLIQGIAQRRL